MALTSTPLSSRRIAKHSDGRDEASSAAAAAAASFSGVFFTDVVDVLKSESSVDFTSMSTPGIARDLTFISPEELRCTQIPLTDSAMIPV